MARPSALHLRVYRALLHLLPSDFRAEFGHEMETVFADQLRDRPTNRRAAAAVWMRTVLGFLMMAPAEHADVLAQDARYARRSLLRARAYTVTVVGSLAIGVAGAFAVFLLLDAVVLRPLPVAHAERLVWFDSPSFSYPIFDGVRTRLGSLDAIFGWDIRRLNVRWESDVVPADVMTATGAIHDTLGITAALGRTLQTFDDGAPEVAVISYDSWQQRFGGDAGVVGRTIRLERVPVTIVGVTPRGFFGVAPGLAPDLTVPAALVPRLVPDDEDILESPTESWLHIMGRRAEGVSLEQANAALRVVWPQVLEAVTPRDLPRDRRAMYLSRQTALMDGISGFSSVRRRFAEPLWLLLGLVGLLLVVAEATVGHLVMSRAVARHHELAVRRALGAGRGRLVRQLLTEALMLAAAGVTIGVVIGHAASRGLIAVLSTADEPIALTWSLDWRTAAFAVALAVLSIVVMVAATLATALRKSAGESLNGMSRRTYDHRARRLGRMLVGSQVALSLLLLVGGGLLVRNVTEILRTDAGFDRQHMVLLHADAVFAGYRGDALYRFHETALERLRAVPGVVAASASSVPPLSHEGSWTQNIGIDGAEPARGPERTFFNAVSPAYFATTGTRVLAGREFLASDDAAAAKVVIVNAALARESFGTANPIGRRISIGLAASRQDLQIVGVVQTAKYQLLQEPDRPTAYLPLAQSVETVGDENVVYEMRSASTAAGIVASARQALRALDPDLPVRYETIGDRIAASLVQERALAALGSAVGLAALLLACGGLFGLMAYAVACRTREFGVRLALGAAPSSLRRLVLGETARLTAGGVVAGGLLALWLSRWLQGVLTAVAPTDVVTLATASVVVLLVGVLAGDAPARRGARVNPTEALRAE